MTLSLCVFNAIGMFPGRFTKNWLYLLLLLTGASIKDGHLAIPVLGPGPNPEFVFGKVGGFSKPHTFPSLF
jgi:hypothetical protein